MNRAVQPLFRSQLPVTRQISTIDAELSVPLLDWFFMRGMPAVAGREVLDRVHRLLSGAHSMPEVSHDPGDSACVTVARFWTLAPHKVEGALAAVHPKISLELDISTSHQKRHRHRVTNGFSKVEYLLKQTELLAESKQRNKATENPMRGMKSAIVPNSIIVPALPSKRVNIDGIITVNSKEQSTKHPLCLTREFHVDALRAQHEYRALGRRLRGAANNKMSNK